MPEIIDQTFPIHELITLLSAVDMLVIPFARLIVEANHADAINDERETIFEFVRACADRGRNPPDHDLGEAPLPEDPSLP